MAKGTSNLSWSPWIWNVGSNWKSNLSDGYHFGDILGGFYGFNRNTPKEEDITSDLSSQISSVLSNSRSEYLEDRVHTEAREDTAYQRAVADMQAAGLNPYTIGSTPASSSSSSVGENTIMSKLQAVGYIMDLKNLDLKNKELANGVLGNILGFLAKKNSTSNVNVSKK